MPVDLASAGGTILATAWNGMKALVDRSEDLLAPVGGSDLATYIQTVNPPPAPRASYLFKADPAGTTIRQDAAFQNVIDFPIAVGQSFILTGSLRLAGTTTADYRWRLGSSAGSLITVDGVYKAKATATGTTQASQYLSVTTPVQTMTAAVIAGGAAEDLEFVHINITVTQAPAGANCLLQLAQVVAEANVDPQVYSIRPGSTALVVQSA